MLEGMQFNTDSCALARRIEAHEKYGSNDLNPWVFDIIALTEGLSVLELGCGTGKQTIPVAAGVGSSGRVLAVDISQAALDALHQEASTRGLDRRVKVLCCGLDDLDRCLRERAFFDVVLSCFSLYYAHEPEKVLHTVYRTLRPSGVLFFCGPAGDNNLQLKRFHWAVKGGRTPDRTEAGVFMEETGPELTRRIFRETQVLSFQNDLRFDSPDALYAYWSSYNLYEPQLDVAFKTAAEKHFEENSLFVTTKRVIGVKSVK